jgi:hypothetical protein
MRRGPGGEGMYDLRRTRLNLQTWGRLRTRAGSGHRLFAKPEIRGRIRLAGRLKVDAAGSVKYTHSYEPV